jgi:serine/threonine protein phosphatase PrpC
VSAATTQTLLRLRSTHRTHAGARRAVNEDRVLDRAEAGLWAVADGVGGHQRGDVAANQVIDALMALETAGSGYSRMVDAERALQAVNANLFADSRGQSGATVVVLLAHEDHFACLWAGDSRAYLLRDRHLTAISYDHSLVQALVDGGEVAEADRRDHPSVHIITRAVGAGPTLNLDRRFAAMRQGDIFLLCSDGLTICFQDDELAGRLDGDLDAVADVLLAQALARGAPDNVSFVLIEATEPTA